MMYYTDLNEFKKFANEVVELTELIIKTAKNNGYSAEHLMSSVETLYRLMEEKKK